MKENSVAKNEKLMKEWNWEKNNALNIFPDQLTCGSNKRVWWKCKRCGYEWQTRVSHRNRGTGCKRCLYDELSTATKGADLESLYPDVVKEWNYQKNLVKPSKVYPNSNKKYWWICKYGHEWQDTPTHRVSRNSKCPVCTNRRILAGVNDLSVTHPKLIKEWDWKKNDEVGIYPNAVGYGSNKKVSWICEKGHVWQSVIYARTINNGSCPVCQKELRTSYPEKIVAFYVAKIFNIVENYRDESLSRCELDIFIPSIKVGIEYDGSRWHQNIENDLLKDRICEECGIKLIRIREYGCPQYESSACKIYTKGKDFCDLSNSIKEVIKFLEPVVGKEINVDMNIARDSAEIMQKVLTIEKEKSIAKSHLISEWNWDRNGKIDPNQVLTQSNKKFWWMCNKGHEWFASVAHRTNGRNCPYCSGQKTLFGFNDLQTQYPAICKEWDYEKNEKMPSEVNARSNKKYWWTCSKCGASWKTAVMVRTVMRCGCPECKKKAISKSTSKKVINKDTGNCYNSIKESGEKTGINPSAIANCCRGASKSAGGFHWEYVDNKKD